MTDRPATEIADQDLIHGRNPGEFNPNHPARLAKILLAEIVTAGLARVDTSAE
ncbi:MAG TPA: hypothetical protein VMB80_04315 [Candidatus Acidoferrum sp.]|nr:hypothetical protein [Candidatus Acidoferrum sp.]